MSPLSFFAGKRIFITGHTGFKGSWLTKILADSGAQVTGYALDPCETPNLFNLCHFHHQIKSISGDVRDYTHLKDSFDQAKPEIVFHLAAQPIVRESYQKPHYTYETNVMGTVNILECVRQSSTVRSFLNVTTDKVYLNDERGNGFTENDPLDGFDPYSNSKSCSELVTHSYKNSFFTDKQTAISTARAGNVIGGGDFAHDRIIPDCIRAFAKGEKVFIRNPHSTRPYQHVLEPLSAYLLIAEKQYQQPSLASSYNVGPDYEDCVTTGKLVDSFCQIWGDGTAWETGPNQGPHEANFLKLNCSKIKQELGWVPRWHIQTALEKTAEWAKIFLANSDINPIMENQISAYFS